MNAGLLHAAYIGACLIALALVYRLRVFDLRSLKRSESEDEAARFDLFDRPDLGAVVGLLVIGGTVIAMLIGWRIPAEIERIWGGGARFGIIFPSVDMTLIGRLAQVV